MGSGWARINRLAAALACAAALIAGCGGGSDGGGAPATPPPAPAPAPTPGTGTIDARGGTVTSTDGVTITVPADALATSTTIRIARDSAAAPAFAATLDAGDIYALTPHGTRFATPAEVRIPIPAALAASNTLTIAKAESGGEGWTLLDGVRREGNDLVVAVDSFSFFRAVDRKIPTISPFDVRVQMTSCEPGLQGLPGGCVGDASATVGLRVTSTGDSFATCDPRAPVTVSLIAYPAGPSNTNGGPLVQPLRTNGIVLVDKHPVTGTATFPNPLPVIPVSIDTTRSFVPWLGYPAIWIELSVDCYVLSPIGTVGAITEQRGGVAVAFLAEARQPRLTQVNGVPYLALRWARQPSAPVGVEGQPLTIGGMLEGGASIAASIPLPFAGLPTTTRGASQADSATVDWERSDDNGLSWHNVGRSWEYEADPDPFNAGRPWRFWSSGYGLRTVTRADADALFRGRACYTLPNAMTPNCALSENFRLTIAPQGGAPTITSLSPSQLVREGQTASFTVAAAGLPAPTLQWRQLAPGTSGFVDIPGATGTTLTTAATTLAQNGTRYRVVATNGLGTATSADVTLSVSATDVAPAILTQPAALAVVAGSEAVFAVDARGTEALSYAWRKDGVAIAGANGAVLKLAAVAANAAGVYSVQVSNGAGSVTSNGAALSVTPGAPGATAPSIVTQPTGAIVTRGSTVAFAVGVAGTGPFTYQWQRNGTAIGGATAAVHTIASAADTDGGVYAVVVTNGAGTATSNPVELTVTAGTPTATAPTITTQPASLAVFPGATATLAVAATGSGPLAYQWRRDGVDVPGATTAVLTLANVTGANAGAYTVTVSNMAGSVASSSASLLVIGAPVIATHPQARTVTEGQAATFTVAATGDALRYQWTRNGVAIDGATAAGYTTPALALADGGTVYAVIVYNGAGLLVSQPGVVTVNAAPAPTAQADSIAAGFRHTCALRNDGKAACWGYNSTGQIGTGNYNPWPTPFAWTTVPEAVRSVAAGDRGSCAVTASGRVFCAGSPTPGSIGNVPTEITALGTVRQVVVGAAHACALMPSGSVQCWGNNSAGQLGNGSNLGSATPVTVLAAGGAPLGGVAALEAGDDFTCALLTSTGVACWGYNNGGQTGQGATTDTTVARGVSGLSGVTRVAAGALHACARIDDGTVRCWGTNLEATFGNGTTSNVPQPAPTAVPNLANVASIASGTRHLCALMNDATVRCWGTASMGNGNVSEIRLTPVTVGFLTGVVALAAGLEHTCALRDSGQLACWGAGGEGQLGQGDTAPRTVPTAVPGGAVWQL